MCRHFLAFISRRTVHSAKRQNQTERSCVVIQRMTKKKMLEVAFDSIPSFAFVRRWRPSLVRSLRSQTPALQGGRSLLVAPPLNSSVGRRLRLCLFEMLRDRRSGSRVVSPPPSPAYCAGAFAFQWLEFLRPQSPDRLLKSPEQGAWNHVGWLFPGLHWLNDSLRPSAPIRRMSFIIQPAHCKAVSSCSATFGRKSKRKLWNLLVSV